MDKLEKLNNIANETNTNDFRVSSYNGADLSVTGSFDFTYYHEIEILFKEVRYMSIPSEFSYPQFRIGSEKERQMINALIALEESDTVFCIEAETTASLKRLPFYIIAQEFDIREGTVYYYYKNDIKTGERIAPWVDKPHS